MDREIAVAINDAVKDYPHDDVVFGLCAALAHFTVAGNGDVEQVCEHVRNMVRTAQAMEQRN